MVGSKTEQQSSVVGAIVNTSVDGVSVTEEVVVSASEGTTWTVLVHPDTVMNRTPARTQNLVFMQ